MSAPVQLDFFRMCSETKKSERSVTSDGSAS